MATETETRPLFIRLTLPNGLEEALEGLAREVLRSQPDNILEFAANHFEQLVKTRGSALGREKLFFELGEKLKKKPLPFLPRMCCIMFLSISGKKSSDLVVSDVPGTEGAEEEEEDTVEIENIEGNNIVIITSSRSRSSRGIIL